MVSTQVGGSAPALARLRSWVWRRRDEPVDPKVRGALLRYRVMSYLVGVGLVVLVCVGIPLQVAHHKIVVEVVGPLHGYLYIVYLLTGYDLARRDRWGIGRILLVVAAGLVPFLAFVVEWFNRRRVEEELRALEGSAASRPPGPVCSPGPA